MGKIVVVGAGQAGAALVARLRNRGCEDAVTLIGDEPVPPYQRPPLSKAYLLGEMSRERLFLRPESFYAEHDIDLRTGTAVQQVNTDERTVTLGGEVIGYDELVLTTGSRPRRLPASIGGRLEGVHVVRTLSDIDAISPRCHEGSRVLIVGGGYIGLEAAAVTAKLGLHVTLIEAAERILQRVAAPETSEYFRALHRTHNVDLREGTGLARLTPADDAGTPDHVGRAELTDGSHLEVDFVLVGIGIDPDTRLAEMAGVTLENGIRTDALGRCSVPHVWAAGDCASLPYRDGRIRLESVQNAIDQAEAVADNLMGADTAYVPSPWFWSDQYDVKLQIAGLNAGYDQVVLRPGEGASQSVWYYGDGTLLAVDAMNAPRDYMIGKRLIEAGRSPEPSEVAAPETDLKALLSR